MGDFPMIHATEDVIDLVKNAYPLPALLRKDCLMAFMNLFSINMSVYSHLDI